MLSAEQVDKLKLTLASSGWREVIFPAIQQRAQEAVKNLVLNPAERAGEYEGLADDQIRHRIRALEWMSRIWDLNIQVADHNRRLDELDSANNPPANP